MKRAEAVCFDECGWLEEEVFQVIEPYTAQNKDFKLGGGVDVTTLPKELPNQLLYTSSASSIDSYYYTKYKEYSKKMIYGSKDHFVSDINCEVMFNATVKGKIYPVSLLTPAKVENAMSENKEKALREYYNIFTTDAGVNAIVKRNSIVKNSYVVPPKMYNDDGGLYVLCYDPARSLDNSVVLICQLYQDEKDGWKMKVVNCVNFLDINKKKKTPMRTPEQVEYLKRLILDYNGKGASDYENINAVFIDAGSGGSGVNIADYLMDDWYEKGHEGDDNFKHRGLIDKEYSEDYIRKFPNAMNKVRLLAPSKYKSEIYEALIEMINMDLISFPAEYDNKGYLTMIEVDDTLLKKTEEKLKSELKDSNISPAQYKEQLEQRLSEVNGAKTKVYHLSAEEESALAQIDALKEELDLQVRFEETHSKIYPLNCWKTLKIFKPQRNYET